MSAVSILSQGRSWRFMPLPPASEDSLLCIIARCTVLDDITLEAPGVSLEVKATNRAWSGRAGPDGLVGVIGRPTAAAPAAQLAGTPADMEITAPGYQSMLVAGVIPPQPGLPAVFTPLNYGIRRLLRLPLVIEGRVLRRIAGELRPVAGAVVTITAATPVAARAGALPPPVAVAALVGTTAAANADGEYRFPALARFRTLTLAVTAPTASPPWTLHAPMGPSRLNQDFHLI
jgi:hypothetical protein